jgi:hypothetical protein
MPTSFIQFWQLKQRGVQETDIRGFGQHRQPDERWPLPVPLRTRLRPLLLDLGFDPTRDVWVQEFPLQHVFRFTQRAREEERKHEETQASQRKLKWLENDGLNER